jgi:hypothetical protein
MIDGAQYAIEIKIFARTHFIVNHNFIRISTKQQKQIAA